MKGGRCYGDLGGIRPTKYEIQWLIFVEYKSNEGGRDCCIRSMYLRTHLNPLVMYLGGGGGKRGSTLANLTPLRMINML